ncbi:hypothetical protein [Pararhizobium sp. LjRoot238]|uniref:hypothetical protein n=1 Tax=Pararhizobium sp. LjRoot238 TaxID=3342293 RepID=UPI003ECD5356
MAGQEEPGIDTEAAVATLAAEILGRAPIIEARFSSIGFHGHAVDRINGGFGHVLRWMNMGVAV